MQENMVRALDVTSAELAAAVGGLPASTLRIERWAPGDGRARYRLMYVDWEGIEWECGPYMGRAALLDTLGTLRAIASRIGSDKRKHRAALADMAS